MVTPRRLVIAASDPRHALPLQAHLRASIQMVAPVVRFEEVPNLLSPETDGDLVLVAQDVSDVSPVDTVVREAKVQQLPARITLVESELVRNSRLLDYLSSHLAARWMWPVQSRELTAWARCGLLTGTPFADPVHESVRERIRRRLLNHTPSLSALVDPITIASDHDVNVLIEGETGTGKSFLARLIHECSARRHGRFVTVACGTLSGNALSSELYGHAAGAFAGADTVKVGKFAAAEDGTLLLDEIDSLAMEQQAALLRVLETGEFEPVGSHAAQASRARVITSTNWNLADAVERSSFRRDLYYRLHVVNLHLPPLRHRPEDIGPLARGLVARFGTRFGKRLFSICPEALRTLESFPWPGNIRQLENVLQQAVLTSTGSELKPHHLSAAIHARTEDPVAAQPTASGFGGTLKQSRESSERANIVRALEKAGQSRTRAAQLLGVSRVTLYKKMKKYGLFHRSGSSIPFPYTG